MKGRILSFLLRIICATSRKKIEGLEIIDELKREGRGIVYCLWHGKMFYPFYFFRERGLRPIISRHRDGELLAKVSMKLGYIPIRGSSTRFGGTALTEAVRALKRGEDVVFAADGPLGPYHQLKIGCIYAAARSGAPILIGSYASRPSRKLNSWDRFNIFPPFSKIFMKIKGPFYIPEGTREEMEDWRKRIEKELKALDAEVEKEIRNK